MERIPARAWLARWSVVRPSFRPASPFANKASRDRVHEQYDRLVERLPIDVERRSVTTRYGTTHVLVAGPPEAPPLLTLHGLNFGGALNLRLLLPLTRQFRVYAPDTPGQAGRSVPRRLDWKQHEYAWWTIDLLDQLQLEKVPFVATSFGGAVLLDAATVAPDRIGRTVLIVPAGLTPVATWRALTRLVWPGFLYRVTRDRAFLRQTVSALTGQRDDEMLEYFDLLAHHVRPVLSAPPCVRAQDLARFESPVALLAARDDVFFPTDRLLEDARRSLPRLSFVAVVSGHHIPSSRECQRLNELIYDFLTTPEYR